MARRQYEDDDGRTVADMSGVTGGGLFLPRRREHEERETRPRRSAPDSPYTPGERWSAALGALKGALLIGFAYLGGLILVVVLLLVLWKVL